MSWAKVGMKVVCVDDIQRPVLSTDGQWRLPDYWGIKLPERGKIYTISGFCSDGGLYLEEIDSGVISAKGEKISYRYTRFRPLVTKTQSEDVAMFKRIADQVPNMEMQE